ncbi:MAG: putative lipid II flippase FtsW [Candidatus Pelagadaptatus aseana]|uniref:putative lipid II flippase FtsW n=1 Tax=Candidatus Pelagadaptatus aseana TaxID=3120508 RepID=UPI0039B28445
MKISAIPPVPMMGQQAWFEAIDWTLVTLVLALMSIGLVAVTSASVSHAGTVYGDTWFFTKRYLLYLSMGLLAGLVVAAIPVSFWERYGGLLLIVTLGLLLLVLIPGLGKEVNGSRRWLRLGVMNLQASEVAKFCMIVFFASLLSRRQQEITASWKGLVKPLMVLSVVILLLLLEPDFGSSVVLAGTVMAMLFMAGVKLVKFVTLVLLALAGLALMAVLSPYRMQRLITFLDPWADQFNSGYQLTQSLIAFGRGEWFGLGLGNSVQKLFYLPEAHTDFIVAIIAEETGLIGVLCLLLIFAALVGRVLGIARNAFASDRLFSGLVAFAVVVMFAGQAFINVGVASGLLPTKGLTMPFISYGGSSLLVSCTLMALVLRLDWEMKQAPASPRGRSVKNAKAKQPAVAQAETNDGIPTLEVAA